MNIASHFADFGTLPSYVHADDLDDLNIDNFAGGGGASTGIEAALGRALDAAINHDDEAIRMHAANHPGTLHIRNNIWRVDPLDVTKGRRVGLIWFSPDCKHFSKAKGGKPREKSIRDLAWVVVHWIKRLQAEAKRRGDPNWRQIIKAIFIENVEEFRTWGPLDDHGYPIKELAGTTFDQWCAEIRKAGGRIEWKELRACDYGTPTIRKRLVIIIKFDGSPITWPTPTHAPADPEERKLWIARQKKAGFKIDPAKLKPWRTAAEIIDWSIPCPSIFDRKKPLADKTLRRIAHGIMKFVVNNPAPFIVPAMTNNTAKPVDDPLSTITASNRLWLAEPFVAPLTHAGSASRSYGLEAPLHTVTGANRGEMALISPHITKFRAGTIGHAVGDPLHTVTANSFVKRPGGSAPLGLVQASLAPFVIGTAFKNTRAARAFAPGEPVRTQTAQAEYAIATAHLAPFVTYAQQGGANRAAEDPLHTICASKKDQNCIVSAVLSPVIVGCGGRRGQSAPVGPEQPYPTTTAKADACIAVAHLAQMNKERTGVKPGRAADAPVSTITTSGSHQQLVVTFLERQFGKSEGAAIIDPLPTTTAGGGGKSALVNAFLAPFYGEKAGGKVRASNAADEPLRTQTCDPRHALVAAHLAQFSETREGRKLNPGHSFADPLSTIVQRGPLQATVTSHLMKLRGTSEAHIAASAEPVDQPLNTVSAQGLHMAEVRAFLLKYYSAAQHGQEATAPLHTITHQARFGLATVTIDGEEFVIVDIGMRMLTPRELFNAQGFPPDYIIDRDADGKPITKTAQVAKCGNSVCPPLAEALVRANLPAAIAEREQEAA
ncbi:DNA (cytosine-5)-methyltransferase 1 [Sphingopyxis panaciterrae]|uniref:DNA cytosine methyltransferase n=1 Tax=Sphingopyxis panaciterrae TaxID=363841 RepID=UPI00141E6099|nr:DNA cytosine methyltransferase [Sphingopyxis panaciterrae]NIJ37880.1 DNA (cytosine-5)-methyltransferase 1 [Sphingopyxis panaciterrae]